MATVSQPTFTDPKTENPSNHVSANRRDMFSILAVWSTRFTGGRGGFMFAFGIVVLWAVTGPFFSFSDNWQLVINTVTNLITFLMVFLIQNAQNRESKAVHLKLDELILSTRRARNELINVETLTEEQLDRLASRYQRIADNCNANRESDEFLNPPSGEHVIHAVEPPSLAAP